MMTRALVHTGFGDAENPHVVRQFRARYRKMKIVRNGGGKHQIRSIRILRHGDRNVSMPACLPFQSKESCDFLHLE